MLVSDAVSRRATIGVAVAGVLLISNVLLPMLPGLLAFVLLPFAFVAGTKARGKSKRAWRVASVGFLTCVVLSAVQVVLLISVGEAVATL